MRHFVLIPYRDVERSLSKEISNFPTESVQIEEDDNLEFMATAKFRIPKEYVNRKISELLSAENMTLVGHPEEKEMDDDFGYFCEVEIH